MKRIFASTYRDLVLLYRNGFYYPAVLVVILLITMLHFLSDEFAYWLVPLALLGNFALNGFYFSAAMTLLEKAENALDSHFVTPLRPWEYVAAKMLALSVITLFETLAIVVVVGVGNLGLLLLATGSLVGLNCLAGLMMVTRYGSINRFLMPSVLVTYLLIFPAIDLMDLSESVWLWLHPFYAPMVLLEGAFRQVLSWEILLASGLTVLWLFLGVWVCQHIIRRFSVAT